MNKKTIIIAIISVLIVSILAGGFWKWQQVKKAEEMKKVEEQKRQEEEKKNTYQQNTEIDKSDWKTYRNDEYGFEMKLPPKILNLLEVNIEKVNYEVGQIDKCVDCALIRFIVPTEDLNSCPFPGECGKAIMFVIWVRDLKSWNINNYNENYACIDSNKVIAKTSKYVYNLCPFNINKKDLNYKPSDIQELIKEVLPAMKKSFKFDN